MIVFFANAVKDGTAWFDEEESKHCLQVLRKQAGDTIHFVDGNGFTYTGTISNAGKKHLTASVQSQNAGTDLSSFRLHMAVAPNKNMERFEWFLEKAVEIGIAEITPIETEHTERTKLRYDRLEKIIRSAMKQSMRTWLPKLNPILGFEPFVKLHATKPGEGRFICHCQSEGLPSLKSRCQAGQDALVMIGPAGDFSRAEVDFALGQRFVEAGLGNIRLRTETAAIVACHTVNLLNQP